MSIEGQGHGQGQGLVSSQYIFQALYVLCLSRPRYQVSVYRTIGPLVRYTFNNLFIIYPLNGYFTIGSAPIYNIQDHPAFRFVLVNVRTIISSALAGYSCSPETPPTGAKW